VKAVLARLAVAGALLAATAAAAPPVRPSSSPEDAPAATSLEEVRDALVQLVTIRRDTEARVPRGSAFYVTPSGYLLTCAHVVDHLPREEAARLRLADGTERRFQIVHVDREIDLALLWSDRPPRYVVLSGDPIAPPGQRVMVGGYPVRGEEHEGHAAARFKDGTIMGLERRRVSGARMAVATRRTIVSLKVDAIADAGQSGGPLLVEGSFAVAGVVRANLERETGGLERLREPEGGAVAVPMLYVRPFLERYE
jgi:serine protease Do